VKTTTEMLDALKERIEELEALLTSARAIAQRRGVDVAWERFDKSIEAAGVGAITARTYRVLPSDLPPPPADHSQVELSGGGAVSLDHRELRADGQQKGYVVLSPEERAKGYVRPVRTKYIHVGNGATFDGPIITKLGANGCGTLTRMAQDIAETYARDPSFYSGTFCVGCKAHLPLDQFVWAGTSEQVGS